MITTAAAMLPLWVKLKCSRRIPLSAAKVAATPDNLSSGAPPAVETTSSSCHDRPEGTPSALRVASLAAAIGALCLGKDLLGKATARALQGTLHPLNRAQIQTDAQDHEAHSLVQRVKPDRRPKPDISSSKICITVVISYPSSVLPKWPRTTYGVGSDGRSCSRSTSGDGDSAEP